MDRISINLLPPSLKQNKQLIRRKKLINQSSIAILGVLIIFTAILITISVFQNNQLNRENSTLTGLNNRLNSLKEKEVAVIILKNRLSGIQQILDKEYPQTAAFTLVSSLLPPGTQMQSFEVNQSSQVTIHGVSADEVSLQQLFDNLTDPKINDGQITKTVISSLSRAAAPQLIFDLEISTKIGKQ